MNDSIQEVRRKNLAAQLEKSNLSKSDFAKSLGVSRSYLSQILSTGFRFGEKAARAFEEKLLLPSGSLDSQEESGLGAVEVWSTPDDLPAGMFAMVPRVAVELSAGAGAIVDEEIELPPLAFRTDWLKKKGVTHRDALRTCDVRGDSMWPYLEDGDVVLIDTGQKAVEDGAIYAIRYGDDVRIKRLSKRFDGGLIISSDNKAYPEETLNATEAQHIAVIGRMLWRGGGAN